ncbi:hypothetical protein WDW89_21415 [Deltaproteobacteria bacterium TL4]
MPIGEIETAGTGIQIITKGVAVAKGAGIFTGLGVGIGTLGPYILVVLLVIGAVLWYINDSKAEATLSQ